MSDSNNIKIALVQSTYTPNAEHNQNHYAKLIRDAASQGAQLVILPELYASPYFCIEQDSKNFDLAEPLIGPTTKSLGKLAAELSIIIVTTIFEKRANGIYHNTAIVLNEDGRLAGKYRKMHIPDDPGYNEKFYFTPGDTGFMPIKTSIANLGVMVCWDQWFPEAARLMALAGAELFIFPTAIGWDPKDDKVEQYKQLDAWITIQRSHAIANGLPLIACNRTGMETNTDDTIRNDFWGNSFICGCQGELIATSSNDETIIIAEVDLSASERIRRAWPYLRDRRVDAYTDLSKLSALAEK